MMSPNLSRPSSQYIYDFMEVITVFQDYKCNISHYKDNFEDILSFKDIIGSQNCVLEANGDIQIRNYIGTFSTGNTCLQVLPKIYSDRIMDTEQEIKKSLALVYRLLVWSQYLSIKRLKSQRSIDPTDTLLEVIIRIFIEEFLQLHRRNVYREYQSKEEDLIFIKGKILFHKSISFNPAKSLRKRVQYDELTINNPINQILKTVFFKLLAHTQNSSNRQSIRLCLGYLEEVDIISLNRDSFENLQYNRINQEYKPLMELAQILCQQQQPGMAVGDKTIISFTLQLNLLYEYFAKTLLEEIYLFPHKVRYQSGGYLAKIDKADYFHLKPDFRIIKDKKTLIILDTKFKNPLDEKGDLKISSSDVCQMCTYAIRFECKSIVLIYPLFLGQEKKSFPTYVIHHGTMDFKIRAIQINLFQKEYQLIRKDLKDQLMDVI